jgi:poly(A) polymerase
MSCNGTSNKVGEACALSPDAVQVAHVGNPRQYFEAANARLYLETILKEGNPYLPQLQDALQRAKAKAYLVGGSVRDAIMGKKSNDLDMVVPVEAIALAHQIGGIMQSPSFPLDKDRDMGRVALSEHGTYLDFAPFRGGGGDLVGDLAGRDFTINAIALEMGEGGNAIIDPLGGLADIQAGIVRQISPTSIPDDPLRALRGLRFGLKYGFRLEAETAKVIKDTMPTLMSAVSAERIRDELNKMLGHDAAGAIRALRQYDGLATILPEVAAMDGLTQSPPHYLDVGAHSEMVVAWTHAVESAIVKQQPTADPFLQEAQQRLAPYADQLQQHLARELSPDVNGRLLLKWGAVFHDIGKPQTRTIDETGRIRYYDHDEVGADMATKRLETLRFTKEGREYVGKIVAGHMRPLLLGQEGEVSPKSVHRFFNQYGEAGVDICLLALADHLGTYDPQTTTHPHGEQVLRSVETLLRSYYTAPETIKPEPLLRGNEVIAILGMKKGGPEVGRLMTLLIEAQAMGEVTTREAAEKLVRENARQP